MPSWRRHFIPRRRGREAGYTGWSLKACCCRVVDAADTTAVAVAVAVVVTVISIAVLRTTHRIGVPGHNRRQIGVAQQALALVLRGLVPCAPAVSVLFAPRRWALRLGTRVWDQADAPGGGGGCRDEWVVR